MYGAYQRAASGGGGEDSSKYSAYESDTVELHKTDVRMGAASQSRAKLICAGFCLFAVGLIIGVLSGKPRQTDRDVTTPRGTKVCSMWGFLYNNSEHWLHSIL